MGYDLVISKGVAEREMTKEQAVFLDSNLVVTINK